jgi:hypothetical protein
LAEAEDSHLLIIAGAFIGGTIFGSLLTWFILTQVKSPPQASPPQTLHNIDEIEWIDYKGQKRKAVRHRSIKVE